MTKNSNLEIHPPNSESQVLDSFDSLLIPSEPPDLKNWFSSYKYDSPELNTGDGLEGCGSLRGNDSDEEGSYVEDSFKEKEENLREFGKIGKKDEITADEKVDSEGFIRFENPIEDNDAHQFVLDTGAAELCAFLDSWSIREMDGDIPNIKKWNVLYPVYINSKKTIAEGRRINATKACENPTCTEIGDCCSHLKIPFAIEIDKAYPRDFMQRGRMRFLLKREDGTLYNPAISSRKQLMLHVAELVPRHPGRTKKQESVSTSTAGPSKSGKGGKKKR